MVFYVHGSMHHESVSLIVQQGATIYSFIIFLHTALHVSSDLAQIGPYWLPSAVAEESERSSVCKNIIQLYIVTSCWTIIDIMTISLWAGIGQEVGWTPKSPVGIEHQRSKPPLSLLLTGLSWFHQCVIIIIINIIIIILITCMQVINKYT